MVWNPFPVLTFAIAEISAEAGWFETLQHKLTADLWVWFGLGAQSVFFARWLVQWEKILAAAGRQAAGRRHPFFD